MKANWIPAMLVAALSQGFAEDAPQIKYKPISIAAMHEFGMLQSGRFGGDAKPLHDEWTDHTGAFLTQEVDIGDNLNFRVGIGGLFEFQKAERISANWGGTQYRSFFVGPTVADLTYTRGPISFGMGMFPYKYNPDAANLGEYLFRSGPYPGYIWSGGYAYVGDNQAYLQGMKSTFKAGNFTADLLAITETNIPPLYDITLGAVLKYRVADGLLDLTAGANFKRLIPIHPSKTTRSTVNNSYFTNVHGTWTGKINYYVEHANFYKNMKDTAAAKGQDTMALAALAAKWKADADSVRAWTAPTAPVKPAYGYYTQQGIVAMVAASVDFKKLFTSDIFGPNDLRLYSEAAILGIKDYPIFYDKKAERIPVMVGFNVPGFKFIDLISVQAEFYNSSWLNSYLESGANNEATPQLPEAKDKIFSKTDYNDVTTDDNLYWSVLIRKQLMQGLNVTGQLARDHIRSVSASSFGGPGTDPNEIFYSNKDWYWMLQFSFGI